MHLLTRKHSPSRAIISIHTSAPSNPPLYRYNQSSPTCLSLDIHLKYVSRMVTGRFDHDPWSIRPQPRLDWTTVLNRFDQVQKLLFRVLTFVFVVCKQKYNYFSLQMSNVTDVRQPLLLWNEKWILLMWHMDASGWMGQGRKDKK